MEYQYVTIEQECPSDFQHVENIITQAFYSEAMSDQTEHLLVNALRGSEHFIPELSLVAKTKQKIVGHILFTEVYLCEAEGKFKSLALAPVSVHPDFQKKGIGSKLINDGHSRAKELGYESVVLIGHEDYYPRFGYVQADLHQIRFPFEVPPQNAFVKALKKGVLKEISGVVEYPAAFFTKF